MEYKIQNAHGTLLGKKVVPSQLSTEVCLEKNELFRLENDPHGQAIQIVEGRVWLTQACNRLDVILEKGQTHQITGAGLVLLQGLPTGCIRFV
jgi:hypothetical protein